MITVQFLSCLSDFVWRKLFFRQLKLKVELLTQQTKRCTLLTSVTKCLYHSIVTNFGFMFSYMAIILDKRNNHWISNHCWACASIMQWTWVRSLVGISFLGEVFQGFSSPVRQMSGSFRREGPWISFGHHYHHHSSFITGNNDLRCWCNLKPQIYIHTSIK